MTLMLLMNLDFAGGEGADDNFDFGYAAPAARFEYAAPASVLDYAAPAASMEYAAP